MRTKALVLALFSATLVLVFTGAASAAAFTVLHSFGGPDGETPAAPLVQGADGFVYGVAAHGGDFTVLPPDGGGTIFRLDASGTVTTLHTFKGPEGAHPNSLIQGRDGFFYGTATLGGQPSISNLNPGLGTIFRMDATGVVTVLHVFPYSIGGGSSQPGPIVQGADGALYGGALGEFGTTAVGGYIYRFDPFTGDFRHLQTSPAATAQSRLGRSSRPATDSSTGQPTRVGCGIRASSTRSTSSATSCSSTASHRSFPARAPSLRAA
jgi:uncharacterized repeat protein (TIGR03803 family)